MSLWRCKTGDLGWHVTSKYNRANDVAVCVAVYVAVSVAVCVATDP